MKILENSHLGKKDSFLREVFKMALIIINLDFYEIILNFI